MRRRQKSSRFFFGNFGALYVFNYKSWRTCVIVFQWMSRVGAQTTHGGRTQRNLDWIRHNICGEGAQKNPNWIKHGGHDVKKFWLNWT